MSTVTVACPNCNSLVHVPQGTLAGKNLPCSRCGETFAYRPRDGSVPNETEDSIATSSTAPSGDVASDSFGAKVRLLGGVVSLIAGIIVLVGAAYLRFIFNSTTSGDSVSFLRLGLTLAVVFLSFVGGAFFWLWYFRVQRTNKATALFILGNMSVLAVLGLTGALATQQYRRETDAGLHRRLGRFPTRDEDPLSNPVSIEPGRLPALGFLPSGTNLVAGIHVHDLLATPMGQKLLKEPIKIGGASVQLAELPQRVGLSMESLDHLVIGMDADAPLSVVMVIRTLQRYDAARIRSALKAERLAGNPKAREMYQAALTQMKVPVLIWFADERTLLVGLSRESLEKAASPADVGPDPLVREVRQVLSERVEQTSSAWVVGQSADWGKTVVDLALAMLPSEWHQRLLKIRAFAAWAKTENSEVTVKAAFQCSDGKAAATLDAWLVAQFVDQEKGALKTACAEDWLTLQLHGAGLDPRDFLKR